MNRSVLSTDPGLFADAQPNLLRASPLLFSIDMFCDLPFYLRKEEVNYEFPSCLVDSRLIVYLRSGYHIWFFST